MTKAVHILLYYSFPSTVGFAHNVMANDYLLTEADVDLSLSLDSLYLQLSVLRGRMGYM